MHFTRLRLNGFKSFVDPSELVIAPGLTGVVGPNGCGKSNLLEALRWVMGESRPTVMRGAGMEDVIFAGSAARPARAQAEVALTVDNAERLAPAAFNEAEALEVVRRIGRDMGSTYRVNGKEVRARDVQMLFADASTGATSPALVRQGQIAELINARPAQRRRILEDAAGISGLTQRRHEVELRLNATQQNLSRLDDIDQALTQRLQALARQARQAARYREIGEALRRAEAALLSGRWREAEAALAAAEAAAREAEAAAGASEAAAREAEARRAAQEAALPPLREEAAVAAAVLERARLLQGQLEEEAGRAAAALAAAEARLGQIRHDLDREAELDRDASATLERLAGEEARIAAAAEGEEEALEEARAALEEAAAGLPEAEAAQAEAAARAAEAVARRGAADRALAELQARRGRALAEADRAGAEAEAARAAAEEAARALAEAEALGADARAMAEEAEARAAAAEEARAEAEAREAEARTARSAAEGTLGTLASERAALARLVGRETAGAAAVLDGLRVAPGYEHALGAALGDDLQAPEAEGGAFGWHRLPPVEAPPALPDGAEPLAGRVAAPAALARRLGQVGVVADGAAMQARLRPGQRLVSPAGDLWRWDGFCVPAGGAASAAGLALERRNRLEALQAEEAEARAAADMATEAHARAQEEARAAATAEQAAREARREADRRAAEADRASARAEAARSLAASRLAAGQEAADRHAAEAEALAEAWAEAEAEAGALPDPAALRAAAEAARARAEDARRAMLAARARAEDLQRAAGARAARARTIARERADWEERLTRAGARSAELQRRLEAAEAERAAARRLPEETAARRAALAEALEAAGARRSRAEAALSAAETALLAAREAERAAAARASAAREARAAAEARREAARTALDGARSRLEEAGFSPEEVAAWPVVRDLPPSDRLEEEIRRLQGQRDALGAVNLRAEQDAAEAQAEQDQLAREKADLDEAVKKLRAGIASLNREGRERLLAAFDEVNGNFRLLFTTLFGGGEARLTLVESDDPLEAGLELLCQPPGKKLATLSLLSGGEQTLTALALIFAVFLSRPSPVCVLDEVDAPLDDANVARFCDLLDEMVGRTATRFLVITHHAVTMARMDRLFGVTMQEQGVSQIVSVDLTAAEALVA